MTDRIPASPVSGETVALALVDAFEDAIRERIETAKRKRTDENELDDSGIGAARAALVALYERQREGTEHLGTHYAELRKRFDEVSSQLERLKADSLTPAMALHALMDMDIVPRDDRWNYETWKATVAALLRLSQSSESPK